MHNAHSWLDSIEVRIKNTVNKILSTTEFKRGSSLELGRGRGNCSSTADTVTVWNSL